MNKQHLILLFVILALLATAPFTNGQAQQPSEEQLAQALKRFPQADTNKDGKLTVEEIQEFRQSRQRNTRPGSPAQPTQAFDSEWDKDEFPPHADKADKVVTFLFYMTQDLSLKEKGCGTYFCTLKGDASNMELEPGYGGAAIDRDEALPHLLEDLVEQDP